MQSNEWVPYTRFINPVQGSPNPMHGQAGAYVITHTPTMIFYIGSTRNVSKRITMHIHQLNTVKHANARLQQLYRTPDDLEVDVLPCVDIASALAMEQQLLDRYIGTYFCCNVSTDVSAPATGLKQSDEAKLKNKLSNTGRIVSESTKLKMAESRNTWKTSEPAKAHLDAMNASKRRALTIDGVYYNSVAAAAKELRLTTGNVGHRARSKKYPNYVYA